MRSEPLTPAAFSAFGDVIDAGRLDLATPINQGYAECWGDLARIDTAQAGGRTIVSIYRAHPCPLPFRLRLLERHRLGSQAFIPLGKHSFLVIVAPADAEPTPSSVRVFRTSPGQGVNLARGVWHHPLAAIDAGDFLVIERGAPDITVDCEERVLSTPDTWVSE